MEKEYIRRTGAFGWIRRDRPDFVGQVGGPGSYNRWFGEYIGVLKMVEELLLKNKFSNKEYAIAMETMNAWRVRIFEAGHLEEIDREKKVRELSSEIDLLKGERTHTHLDGAVYA